MTDQQSSSGSDYADLVRELHQAAEEYDRGHGPLHAAAANAIDHLMTLIRLMQPGSVAQPPTEPVDITGWKLVPDQSTEAMWQAGRSADIHLGDSYSKVWSAMFDAAPDVDDCETTSSVPSTTRATGPLVPWELDCQRAVCAAPECECPALPSTDRGTP